MSLTVPALLGATLLLPPLVGAWAGGRPLGPLLQFPPVPTAASQPDFSWTAFLVMAGVVAVALLPYLALARRLPQLPPGGPPARRPFPPWGWLGVGLVVAAWYVAWTRHPWAAPVQLHTFTPLWLGYIVVVNAWTHRRTGRSLLSRNPRLMLGLFPLSAAFWWLFEWLNRFVGNWHYRGVEGFTAPEYVFFASIAFSTVLPAVLSTLEWLRSLPRLERACSDLWPVRPPSGWRFGAGVLGLAAVGGYALARWPGVLFPLVWVAPLLAVMGTQMVFGRATAFAPVASGDWRPLLLPPIAGLICGLHWELWNSASLAHWEYTVPYVDRFHLFEMPALGYAGYLPFGLQCLAAASLLPGLDRAFASAPAGR